MPEFKLAGGLAAVVAVALGTSSAMAQREAAFTIRSSLDGKTTLPHRIAWIAYPSAAVEAPGVEFLIDGKVVFRNRLEPYAFGADGRDETQQKKVRTGYLVTSWLSPGSPSLHRPCTAGKHRRRQSDRHENRRRPRSAVARTSRRARGYVAPKRAPPGSRRPRSALFERSRWELSA